MSSVEIKATDENREYWLNRPYLSETVRENIGRSDLFLVPHEHFRENYPQLFPTGTEEFLVHIRESFPEHSVEIAIDDKEYKELALHSATVILAGMVVFVSTEFVVPVLVSVVSDYISSLLDRKSCRESDKVRWDLTLIDGERSIKVAYDGPASSFASDMQKSIDSLNEASVKKCE